MPRPTVSPDEALIQQYRSVPDLGPTGGSTPIHCLKIPPCESQAECSVNPPCRLHVDPEGNPVGARPTPEPEQVDHPAHYNAGSVECIDGIESALGREGYEAFLRGQVIKYLWRAPHKGNPGQDYRKAAWYLDRLVALADYS